MQKLILIFLIALSTTYANVKYNVTTKYELIIESRLILKAQIGVKEIGSTNSGPEVDIYLKSVGLPPKYYWCQALQYFAYDSARKKLKITYMYIPMYKSGLANDTYRYGKDKGVQVAFVPEVDDFIIWKYQKSNSGHIGRIVEVLKSGWVLSIEGNTSNGLKGYQREGNGCFLVKRNIYHPLGKMYTRGLIGVKAK